MRSLEEVLSLLSASQAPADVAETLRRLLRLPAVWAALREPGLVERCLEAGESPLSPGTCLLVACGYSRFSDLPTSPADSSRPASSETPTAGDPEIPLASRSPLPLRTPGELRRNAGEVSPPRSGRILRRGGRPSPARGLISRRPRHGCKC